MTPTSPDAVRVLVVDDHAKNRKLAGDVLRAAGLETLEAATGDEAIAVATDRLPDVILLDLRLPDTHGTDVARALARNPRTASIPVVALSASPDAADGDRLRTAGFAGCLEKPIDVRAFPEQVRRYVR